MYSEYEQGSVKPYYGQLELQVNIKHIMYLRDFWLVNTYTYLNKCIMAIKIIHD